MRVCCERAAAQAQEGPGQCPASISSSDSRSRSMHWTLRVGWPCCSSASSNRMLAGSPPVGYVLGPTLCVLLATAGHVCAGGAHIQEDGGGGQPLPRAGRDAQVSTAQHSTSDMCARCPAAHAAAHAFVWWSCTKQGPPSWVSGHAHCVCVRLCLCSTSFHAQHRHFPPYRLPSRPARDLKPENFLLTAKSTEAELKLTDFGLGE